MTEFLHQVVANREYIQNDREMHRELRNAIENSFAMAITTDEWADTQDVVHPRSEDLGAS
jgi:hypothetical protein